MNPFDQLQNRVERRARREVSSSITGCFISAIIIGLIGVFGIGLAGYIGYTVWASSRDPWSGGVGNIQATAIWDGTGPLVCNGSQVLDVVPVVSTLPSGTAIEAMGNCRMTLHGVTVTAPIAIRAMGNAEVILDGGSYTGSEAAIVAGANAHVVVQGAQIAGAVQRTGGARIEGI